MKPIRIVTMDPTDLKSKTESVWLEYGINSLDPFNVHGPTEEQIPIATIVNYIWIQRNDDMVASMKSWLLQKL